LTPKRRTPDCRFRLYRFFVQFQALALLLICFTGSARAATVDIHAIAVDLPASPYLGQTVTTTGIVIAVLSDGFYIENASSWDSNTCSSEGIYVYTPTGVPSNAVSGNSLTVTGLVQASNSSAYAGVEIYIASPVVGTNVITNSTGNSLPSTVTSSTLTAATNGTCPDYAAGAFGQWLPFEGMLVNIPSSSTLLVTQGTGGTVTPASQTATTNGQFWAVLTTTRPTRSAGISILDPVYKTAIAAKSTIAEWSGNPQLLFVDSTAIGGSKYALDASATTEYTGSSELIGIVDYHLSSQGYTGLLLTAASASALASQSGATPTKVTTRGENKITIATQDLNGLVATETNRITKLAYAIIDYHKSPDIIAVQGATPAALNLLISAITAASGPSYTLTDVSTADSSGLVNAFLVNANKFDGTPTAAQILTSNTYTSTSSTTSALFDRSPLVLTAKIPRTGISDYVMTIVNTSLLSRSGLSSTTTSEDTRLQREQQAMALAAYLAPLESAGHVMVVGGFDSFEFSDGYVDTLGILDGLEATNTNNGAYVWLYDGASASTLIDTTTKSPNLTATASAGTSTVTPATSRYTYVESGTAEQPDHILISSEMSDLFTIDYARFGADFPDSLTYTTSTTSTDTMVERASTHDGIVAYFTVPYPTTTTVTNTPNPSVFDEPVTFTATVTVTGSSPTTYATDGTVTFYDTDGTTKLGTCTVSSGTCTFTYSALTVGTHTITVSYGGSESGLGFQSSSTTTTQVVGKDTASLTLVSSVNPSILGQPVTFTATATSSNNAGGSGATPTGTVTFTDTTTSTTLGTGTLSSGVATLSVSTLSIGTHVIEATYGGDDTDLPATSNDVSQVVNANTTTVTVASSLNPSYYTEGITFTATAVGSYGTPTGTITFYDSSTSTTLGTGTLVAGTATYTAAVTSSAISTLSVGVHTIEAIYASDGTHDAATGSLSQTILPVYATTSTLYCSPNPVEYGNTVICTDTVAASTGTPTGTVTFYDGTTSLGTASLSSGIATYTTSSLAVGSHPITAVYTVNYPYLSSTSNQVDEIVYSTFTLTAKPATATIYTGEAVNSTITVVPGTGFTLDVALTCSGLPDNSTCTFTPSTVTGGSGTSKLLIQTTAPSQSKTTTAMLERGRHGWPLLAGLLLFFVPKRFRRRGGIWIGGLLLTAALAASTLTACGGSGTLTGGTPAGTYTVTVTGVAADGTLNLTHTTTVAITVKSMF